MHVDTHSAANATIIAQNCANAKRVTPQTSIRLDQQASVTIFPAVRTNRHTQLQNGHSTLRRTARVQRVMHPTNTTQTGCQGAVLIAEQWASHNHPCRVRPAPTLMVRDTGLAVLDTTVASTLGSVFSRNRENVTGETVVSLSISAKCPHRVRLYPKIPFSSRLDKTGLRPQLRQRVPKYSQPLRSQPLRHHVV